MLKNQIGKRIVVDRQKIKTRSESRRYRVAERLVVKAGTMVRQGQNRED